MRRVYIDFMGNRMVLFAISGVLIAVSIGALAIRGLNLGIEFKGGTLATLPATQGVAEADVRDALAAADVPDAQGTAIQAVQGGGFIVRTAETSAGVAEGQFDKVAEDLGIETGEVNVQTIGPGWGRTVTNKSILALFLSLLAILLYVSVRFEYKMSVTAIVALVHDGVITIGIFALLGRELTPNTIAALLTIVGYSLYDTIVVFHRIKENSLRIVKQTFMEMANDSINQVIVRSINTSLTSLIPVVVLLIAGGPTLRDFAFALVIGLIAGAYSSIGVASPIFAIWKETEPKYRAIAQKAARGR